VVLTIGLVAGIAIFRQPVIGAGQNFDPETLSDPIAILQGQIDRGEVALNFSSSQGYLEAVLNALDIPLSSQTLVFSKTSFQAPRISPENPRALYFNDDVYVGWVNGGPVVEIAAVHPKFGTMFYTLDQNETAKPQFERETIRCISCHLPARSRIPIPRLLVMSILPSRTGDAVGPYVLTTTDRSPLRERWGGWYMTGTHGDQLHRGNMLVGGSPEANAAAMGRSRRANVTDLGDRFDTKAYLTVHSDIIALSLLAHQSEVHNLIGEASQAVRIAVRRESVTAEDRDHSRQTISIVTEMMEPLIRAMLLSGSAPLNATIAGSSEFATEFVTRGPFDSRGRSLRDLDLDGKILRYPLSYLIYSNAFDGMPQVAKDYAYRRLREILSGKDAAPEWKHISDSDRTTVMEILNDTKPDFATRDAMR
jgi:hypothetical protein